jgi:hypothetical protein
VIGRIPVLILFRSQYRLIEISSKQPAVVVDASFEPLTVFWIRLRSKANSLADRLLYFAPSAKLTHFFRQTLGLTQGELVTSSSREGCPVGVVILNLKCEIIRPDYPFEQNREMLFSQFPKHKARRS